MSEKQWTTRNGPEAEWIYGTEQDFDDFWDWISDFMDECYTSGYPRWSFSNQIAADLELNPPMNYNNILTLDNGND